MIYSNNRKLCLSGWLKQNNIKEYDTPLKLQKFLLLYESFSKVAGEAVDFSHLKGYKKGPVFSHVWGDYTKERIAFDNAVEECYEYKKESINELRAKKCAFIVASLSERELSDLTHKMNIWKTKENRIMKGEYQVELDEKDFNEDDIKLIDLLDQMYPIEMIDNSVILALDSHYFVFNKEDKQKLTEEHMDILSILAEKEQLYNPVYVEIDKEGKLIVD